jgi:hypothetical protein
MQDKQLSSDRGSSSEALTLYAAVKSCDALKSKSGASDMRLNIEAVLCAAREQRVHTRVHARTVRVCRPAKGPYVQIQMREHGALNEHKLGLSLQTRNGAVERYEDTHIRQQQRILIRLQFPFTTHHLQCVLHIHRLRAVRKCHTLSGARRATIRTRRWWCRGVRLRLRCLGSGCAGISVGQRGCTTRGRSNCSTSTGAALAQHWCSARWRQ